MRHTAGPVILMQLAISAVAMLACGAEKAPPAAEARERARLAEDLVTADGRPRLAILIELASALTGSESGEAIDRWQEALELARELGDLGEMGRALNALARLHMTRGDHSQALDCAKQAAQIHGELGETAALATSLKEAGTAYWRLGVNEKALVHTDFPRERVPGYPAEPSCSGCGGPGRPPPARRCRRPAGSG